MITVIPIGKQKSAFASIAPSASRDNVIGSISTAAYGRNYMINLEFSGCSAAVCTTMIISDKDFIPFISSQGGNHAISQESVPDALHTCRSFSFWGFSIPFGRFVMLFAIFEVVFALGTTMTAHANESFSRWLNRFAAINAISNFERILLAVKSFLVAHGTHIPIEILCATGVETTTNNTRPKIFRCGNLVAGSSHACIAIFTHFANVPSCVSIFHAANNAWAKVFRHFFSPFMGLSHVHYSRGWR